MSEPTSKNSRLLAVSREPDVIRALWSIAEPGGWQIETAASAWEAIERVQSGISPHLVLLDVPRDDHDTLHILRWLRRLRPDLPIIMICAVEDAAHKSEVMRLGVLDVLAKPVNKSVLETAIHRHMTSPDRAGTKIASEDIEQLGPDSFFISASPISQRLRQQAELLAEADVPVLIMGEPGSGKHMVARLIHKLSVRSGFEFLRVNCADMPAELLEAELFGSETTSGAEGGAGGKLERAERGTIFLDEIDEMPLGLQARFLEVLQDRVVIRRGSERTIPVDLRILAASTSSMDGILAEGKLREDLFYRLSAFTVHVPPLRQRRSEIPVLLRHMMHQLSRRYSLPPREFSANWLDACLQHSWPGNLKELENVVKRYLVSGDQDLRLEDLNAWKFSDFNGNRPAQGTKRGFSAVDKNDVSDGSSPKSLKSLIDSVKHEAERNAIGTALKRTGWNRKAAARLLQVSYRTLLYKIEQYHMRTSDPSGALFSGTQLVGIGDREKGNGKAH